MDPDDRSAPGDTGGEWTKEQPQRDRPFDFDAFLGPEKSLDDQVTDVLDGKDVLDEEARGAYPPGYIPRRGAPGDRGRHEAPEPKKEPEYPGDPPTRRFTKEEPAEPAAPEPPRQSAPPRPPVIPDAPPRPKVVVAEPAPRVVVTPERQYPEQKPPRQGMGKGMKFLIALLISVAVILAVGVLAVTLLPGLRGGTQPPAPSPTDYLFGGLPTWAPAPPAATEPPTAPPATAGPTPPDVLYHTITVTAGTGGSVSPSGLVQVQDGGSVTFTIAPYEGYDLTQLLVNGSNVPLTGSYTFGPVYGDGTIYAVFQPLPATAPPATDVPVTDPPPVTEEPAQPPADQGLPEGPPPAADE